TPVVTTAESCDPDERPPSHPAPARLHRKLMRSSPFTSDFRLPLALGALSLLLSFAFHPPEDKAPHWDLAKLAPAIALKPPVLDKAEENRCAACHADVVKQWATT